MKSRHFQRAGMVAGALVAAILFFLGGAALRLFMGPISLGAFAGAIEDSLNKSITGLEVRFDEAVLEWSRSDGNINLLILGARVFDGTGRIVAQAPKADLDFDAAAMLSGDFSLKRFALLGVQLTAVRTTDGSLRLGFGPIQGEADILEIIRNTLRRSQNEGGSLETFSVREARLAFRDDQSGLFIIAPDIGFSLENADGRFTAALDASVEISGVPAQISARTALRDDGRIESGTLSLKGIDLVALAQNSAKFAALNRYAMKGDLAADFAFDAEGQITTANFQIEGEGDIGAREIETSIHLDSLKLSGRYLGFGNQLVLDSAEASGPEMDVTGKGDFRFDWSEGVLSTVTMGISAKAEKFGMPGFLAAPVVLDDAVIRARYELGARRITWQRIALNGMGLAAELAGSTTLGEEGAPAVSLHGEIGAIAVNEALSFWPLIVARGARSWLVDNVTEGQIGPLAIAIDIPQGALDARPLPEESVLVTFPLENVTARYMRGLTPVTDARGTAQLSGDTLKAQFTEGKVGPIAVSSGEIDIPDLHIPHAPGAFKIHADGRVPDVLTLIDMEPLGYPSRFGVDPDRTTGQASVDLEFVLPMRRDLALEDVHIAVSGKTMGLGAPISATRNLEAGIASFTIDNHRLASEGAGRVSGIPVAFRWNEEFVMPEGPTTRVELQGRIDDATRPVVGLAEPSWVKGPIPATVELTGRRFKFDRAMVRTDLTGTSVSLPQINVVKAPGSAATGSAELHFAGDTITVTDMNVTGSGVELHGGLSFEHGRLVSAALTEVKAGADNDFTLAIDAPADTQRRWRVGGKSLDGSMLFAGEEPAAAPANENAAAAVGGGLFSQPILLDVNVERILLRDEMSLRNVDLELNMAEGERLAGFHLAAEGPGPGGAMTGTYEVVDGERRMTIEAEDAGDFMRAFTGFPSVRGGRAVFRASFPAEHQEDIDYNGNLLLTNFTLVDQPFLARLFSIGTLDGPLRLLQGSGIAFSRLEAPFASHGKVMMFQEGRASGPAMGFSFDGMIDRGNDSIDLNGSLVPVYTLNSMLGALPIVGNLITSKEGEGIFAMTYRIRGDLDEPTAVVNPLSVFTPGILRRIFEFADPIITRVVPDAGAEAPVAQ
jgi:uncharacterized protein YhdP